MRPTSFPSPFAPGSLNRESFEGIMADVQALDLPVAADENLNFIAESLVPAETALQEAERKIREYGRARSDLLLEEEGDPSELEGKIRADLLPVKIALQTWKSGVVRMYPNLLKIPVDHILRVLGREADPALKAALGALHKETPDTALLDRLIQVIEADLENRLVKLETGDRTRRSATETDGGLTDREQIVRGIQDQYLGGANEVFTLAKALTRENLTKKVQETEARERKEKAYDAIPAAAESFFASRTNDGTDTEGATRELFKAIRDAVAAAKGLSVDDASIPTDDDLGIDPQFTKVAYFSLRADAYISERREIMDSANFLARLLGPDNYQTARRMKEEVLARKHHLLSKHFTAVFKALEQALKLMEGPELTSAIGLLQGNLTDIQNAHLVGEHRKATGQSALAAADVTEEPNAGELLFQFGDPDAEPERTPASGVPPLAPLEDTPAPWALPPAPADLRSEGTPGTVRRWPAPATPLPLASAPAPVVSIPPAPRPVAAPAPAPVAAPATDPFLDLSGAPLERTAAPSVTYASPRPPRPRKPGSKWAMAAGTVALGVAAVAGAGVLRYSFDGGAQLETDRRAIQAWIVSLATPKTEPAPVKAPVAPFTPTAWRQIVAASYPTSENPSNTQWITDLSADKGTDVSQGAIAVQCIGGQKMASPTQPAEAHSFPMGSEALTPEGGINWQVDGCHVKGYEAFTAGSCVPEICARQVDGFFAVALTPKQN